MSRKRILALLCVSLTSLASGLLSPDPCPSLSLDLTGFNLKYTFHPAGNVQDDVFDWLESADAFATLETSVTSASHVSAMSELCSLPEITSGSEIGISTAILEGYFVPKQSGHHYFSFEKTGITTVQIGAGSNCSGPSFNEDVVSGNTFRFDTSSLRQYDFGVTLDKNMVYPVRLVITNVCAKSAPVFEITTPGGETVTNLLGYVGVADTTELNRSRLFGRSESTSGIDSVPQPCTNVNVTSQSGFRVDFYQYPWQDPAGKDIFWLAAEGYKELGVHLGTSYSSELFWDDINSANYYPVAGVILGQNVQSSNFMAEIVGYFLPQTSGEYVFLIEASKGLSFQIGSNSSCCATSFSDIVSNTTYGRGSGESFNVSVSLEANSSYPIRMLYYNSIASTHLNVSLVAPGLGLIQDFSGLVSYADPSSGVNCSLPESNEPTFTIAPDACTEYTSYSEGFNVDFYQYPWGSVFGRNLSSFANSGYLLPGGHRKNTTSVTSLNFSIAASPLSSVWAPVYNNVTTSSNFAMEITGFFTANETGPHLFKLSAGYGISFQMGRGNYSCCGMDFNEDIVSQELYGNAVGVPYSVTANLTRGETYPLRLVYFNIMGAANLTVSAVLPDGTGVDDFAGLVTMSDTSNTTACQSQSTGTEYSPYSSAPSSYRIDTPTPVDLDTTGAPRNFRLDFYSYPWQNFSAVNISWLALGGYKEVGYYLSTSFSPNVTWVYHDAADSYPMAGLVYGQTILESNFVAEMTGFITAAQSGLHTFMIRADNGMSFQLGGGDNFCGSNFTDGVVETQEEDEAEPFKRLALPATGEDSALPSLALFPGIVNRDFRSDGIITVEDSGIVLHHEQKAE